MLLTGLKIAEYDIQQADNNVFYLMGLVDKTTYDYYKTAEKIERNVFYGKMQKGRRDIYDKYIMKLKELTDEFVEVNKLEDNVFLTVKDAIWIRGKVPKKRIFHDGLITFVKKNEATSVYIYRKDKYFYTDSLLGIIYTKGFGQDVTESEYPFLGIVRKFMSYKENRMEKEAYRFIHNAYNNYKHSKYSEGYYKPLNKSNDRMWNLKIIKGLIDEL